MYSSNGFVFFTAIVFIAQGILFSIFLREYHNKRVNILLLLVTATGFKFVGYGIELMLRLEYKEVASTIGGSVAMIVSFISLFLLVLFFDLFDKKHPNLLLTIIYSSSLGVLVITRTLLMIIQVNHIDESILMSPPTNVDLPLLQGILLFSLFLIWGITALGTLLVFAFVIPIHIILILIRAKGKTTTNDQRREYTIMLVGFICMFSGIFIGYLRSDLLIPISLIIELFGLSCICGVFLKGRAFIFTAHRLDNLIILNEGGTPIFNYEFPGTQIEMNQVLIGGIISAMGSAVREIAGSKGNVQEISLGDLNIIIRSITEGIVVLLISEKTSRFIIQAVDRFAKEFGDIYASQLKENAILIDETKFSNAYQLVEKIFIVKGTVKPFIGLRDAPLFHNLPHSQSSEK